MTTNADPARAGIDVLRERFRQISADAWSPEREDAFDDGFLAVVASVLVTPPETLPDDINRAFAFIRDLGLRTTASRRDELVAGAAVIIAEIERLDRLAEREGKPDPEPNRPPPVVPPLSGDPEASVATQRLMVDQ